MLIPCQTLQKWYRIYLVISIFSLSILSLLIIKFPSKNDCKYTAFEFNGELLEFMQIPFGFTYEVSAFQQTINQIIKNEKLVATYAFV